MDRKQLLAGVDAVLITHDHPTIFRRRGREGSAKTSPYFASRTTRRGFGGKDFERAGVRTSFDGGELHYRGSATITRATGAPPFGESSSYFLRTKRDEIFFTGDAVLTIA